MENIGLHTHYLRDKKIMITRLNLTRDFLVREEVGYKGAFLTKRSLLQGFVSRSGLIRCNCLDSVSKFL